MELLVFIMNDDSYLPDILSGFMEIGVKGATIIDSTGMGHIVAFDIPIFAGLRQSIGDNLPCNKTIFTVIETPELMEKALQMIKEIYGDLDTPGTGLIFTLPVSRIIGLAGSFE